MKRRDFMTAAGMAGLAPLGAAAALHGQADGRQYLEMRRYHQPTAPHRQRLVEYLEQAAIPAWNRLGIGPVGVFNVLFGPNQPTLYVLLPHPSMESVVTAHDRLAEDEALKQAGAAYWEAPLSDPAYVRIESSLMRAFSAMPRVEAPDTDAERIFELRVYESHGEEAARRKVQMFNEGEIDIFRATGLTPVFFGETVIGPRVPNLTYMLTFRDFDERAEAWDKFRVHPDWRTLSADPYYKDTVSNISDYILRPLRFSQV